MGESILALLLNVCILTLVDWLVAYGSGAFDAILQSTEQNQPICVPAEYARSM